MFVVPYCARCRHPLRVRRCYQGETVRCPNCAAVLTVPDAPAEEPAASAESDPCARRKVRAASAPALAVASPERVVLPWLLLAPAVVALGLLIWAGHGVLWAALGVGLGGLCLLVGQRACWPLSLRIGPSLSLALLGHGLTLAGPLMNSSALRPILTAAEQPTDLPPPLTLNLPAHSESRLLAMTSLRNDPRYSNRTKPVPGDLIPIDVNLDALLAVAVDADSAAEGNVFVTTADSSLKRFSYPGFKLQAVHRLEQPAYRAVMDQRRGLLWVAASDPQSLRVNEYGDRPEGGGDLHVYDIRAVRRPKTLEARLQPRHVLPLQGCVLELCVLADSRWLFYLARTADGVHLGRIDADKRCPDGRLPLPGETRALCGTPDGKTLYAAGGRNVFVIDPASLRVRRRLEMEADFNAVAADNDGRVYLAEEGQWTPLTRLDLRGDEPSSWQWDPKLHGRIYLRMAPDQYRIYVGTSSVLSNHLDSLLIRGHVWNTPPQVGMAFPDGQGTIRGEFFLTPDGKYLLNRWGRVFRVAQGELNLPNLDFGIVGEKH